MLVPDEGVASVCGVVAGARAAGRVRRARARGRAAAAVGVPEIPAGACLSAAGRPAPAGGGGDGRWGWNDGRELRQMVRGGIGSQAGTVLGIAVVGTLGGRVSIAAERVLRLAVSLVIMALIRLDPVCANSVFARHVPELMRRRLVATRLRSAQVRSVRSAKQTGVASRPMKSRCQVVLGSCSRVERRNGHISLAHQVNAIFVAEWTML